MVCKSQKIGGKALVVYEFIPIEQTFKIADIQTPE